MGVHLVSSFMGQAGWPSHCRGKHLPRLGGLVVWGEPLCQTVPRAGGEEGVTARGMTLPMVER